MLLPITNFRKESYQPLIDIDYPLIVNEYVIKNTSTIQLIYES